MAALARLGFRASLGCASRIKPRSARLTTLRAVSGLLRNALALRVLGRFASGSFLAFVNGFKAKHARLKNQGSSRLNVQASWLKLSARGSRLEGSALKGSGPKFKVKLKAQTSGFKLQRSLLRA